MNTRLLLCFGLLLAGCTDAAGDLGRPPPIELVTARRSLALRLRGDLRLPPDEQEGLGREVGALAGDNTQAVRARVQVADDDEGDAVRRVLLTLGLDPARITVERTQAVSRLAPVIGLSRTFARTASCATAVGPAWFGDPAPSLTSLGRCTQANNLATMLADPADLVAPPMLGDADGEYVVNGLRAWRAQLGVGLPSAGERFDTGSGSGSGTGGLGGAGSAVGGAAGFSSPPTAGAPALPGTTAVVPP